MREVVEPNPADDQDTPAHRAALAKQKSRSQFISIGDQVAESVTWLKNWKWEEADKHYPLRPDMRTVDKYYPYAKGGPLLVDEPRTPKTFDEFFEHKRRTLKELGYRYLVIEPDPEFTLGSALEQLGEL